MSINYSPLFLLMRNKKVTQKELIDNCKISPSSFLKMKKGEYVSLELLDRICDYLNCDFKDILTRDKDSNIYDSNISINLNNINEAINKYIKIKNINLVQFSKECGISYNTLLAIRNGYVPSKNTILKLFSLGSEFINLISNLKSNY